MPEVTLTTLNGLKAKGEKITMLTCYDATFAKAASQAGVCLLYTSPSPRDVEESRMPSSA